MTKKSIIRNENWILNKEANLKCPPLHRVITCLHQVSKMSMKRLKVTIITDACLKKEKMSA